jgi:hypothetical protein
MMKNDKDILYNLDSRRVMVAWQPPPEQERVHVAAAYLKEALRIALGWGARKVGLA